MHSIPIFGLVISDGAVDMPTTVIDRIEAEVGQLSLSDQLRLMERLARRIREHGLPAGPAPEDRLAAMADDPDMQRGLRLIEAEFAGAESDESR